MQRIFVHVKIQVFDTPEHLFDSLGGDGMGVESGQVISADFQL